jgi:Uma2 family endonuclease
LIYQIAKIKKYNQLMLLAMQIVSKNTEIYLRMWTVEEYHRMAEVGILQADEPIELVAGQIIYKMSPQGITHATTIRIVRRLLENNLGEKVLVQTQLPIQLNDFSEPEPDVSLVMADELRYVDHHPTPSEVYLIIEVADSILKKDCELKAIDYGSSGIKDYWVLDVNQRQLYVFREATPEGYNRKIIVGEHEQICPLEFPNLSIRVDQMLPPV